MTRIASHSSDLNPAPFSAGLSAFSSGDGTYNSSSYQNAPNAYFVRDDADFGGALEMIKTESVQQLRYKGRTPYEPGCYLRIGVRLKLMSGEAPNVRIAGWAGMADEEHVSKLVAYGPETPLPQNGDILEISAIVGSSARPGVDMVWGGMPQYGHFGLDLTGPSGGVVRIDDIRIEDITHTFLRTFFPVVSVLDYGAVGDGVTDDSNAFEAADAATGGRKLVVPAGRYRLSRDVTIQSDTRFEGTVTQPRDRTLLLRRNFNLASYTDAFADPVEAFRKAFQALLHDGDHNALDLCGRRIEISEPIDMAGAANRRSFDARRGLRNGQFSVVDSPAWDAARVISDASYDPVRDATALTDVAGIEEVEVGAHVTGHGVGREIFVRSKDVEHRRIELSQPLWGAAARQSYGFVRYRYALDFSGFERLSNLTLDNVELRMAGRASGILLPPSGDALHLRDCAFDRPAQRAVSSHGRGCRDLEIDRCDVISDELSLPAPTRSSVGLNINDNGAKIRSCRFRGFGTTMVLGGSGHLVVGNHCDQGDEVANGPLTAGLVFTQTDARTILTGNCIDDAFVEFSNQYAAHPDFAGRHSFGGVSVTGNIFSAIGSADRFSFLVVKPFGTGHFIHGLSVTGNAFRSINGRIDRVERVDSSIAPLDAARARMIEFSGNTFHNIRQETVNPVTLEFDQPNPAQTWTLDASGWMPFSGRTRGVPAVAPLGWIMDADGQAVYDLPMAFPGDGPRRNRVKLNWSRPVRGKVQITARCDKPF